MATDDIYARAMKGEFKIYRNAVGKLETNFPQTSAGTNALVKSYYAKAKRREMLTKASGTTEYGTQGAWRAIMGHEIFSGVFSSNTTFVLCGSLPYQQEGLRIQYDQPFTHPIGYMTEQDGQLPPAEMTPIWEMRQPAKDLPATFKYGLGLIARESYDDTIYYDEYVDTMVKGYSHQLNRDILRPTETVMPQGPSGKETTLTPLSHIIASSLEVGNTYNGTAITADMVSPYGGVNSDIYSWRNSGAENNFDAYVNATAGLFDKSVMDDVYGGCANLWLDSGSPNNKVWVTSLTAQQQVTAELEANHVTVDEMYVQQDFNGVSTFPGRDGGMSLKSYKQVPWFIDGSLNLKANGRPGNGIGEGFLMDLDYIFYRMLTPIEFASSRDIVLLDELKEKDVMLMRGEMGVTRFLGQGKITNKSL